jgi:hypothetical protein
MKFKLAISLFAIGILILSSFCLLNQFVYVKAADPVSQYETNTPIPQLLQEYAGSELLGRPTDKSIAINIIAPVGMAAYVEYGNASGKYSNQSATCISANGEPIEISITNLAANTRYYYQTHYKLSTDSTFRNNSEHYFITQRPAGSTFTFDLQADPHMDSNSDPAVYTNTLRNETNDHPDFLIDLGDTFMTEKFALTQEQVDRRYIETRAFFDIPGSSSPVFLVNGNHDGEFGWVFNSTNTNNDAYWALQARKLYYPNPYPDGFYTGSQTQDSIGGLHENYYAWTWGNALFVVLEPYTYSNNLKQLNDNWAATIGDQQYQWFKQTLEQSNATYKFVFEHHMLSEYRGMTSWVNRFEWGGYNNASVWQFNQMRPNWALPMHQLMVQNNVTIFFQGHDHLFCTETKDGIIYQEVPQPSALDRADNPDPTIATNYAGQIIPSSGYLRIQVSPQNVNVQYVKIGPAQSAGIANNYTVQAIQSASTPIPTPTAQPTSATPSTAPTFQPTPLSSTTLSPSTTTTQTSPKPTPTIPEFIASWVIALLLAGSTLIAITLKKQRHALENNVK